MHFLSGVDNPEAINIKDLGNRRDTRQIMDTQTACQAKAIYLTAVLAGWLHQTQAPGYPPAADIRISRCGNLPDILGGAQGANRVAAKEC